MKRNVNYEDEDAMENVDSWSEDGNGIDIGKRGGGKSLLNYFGCKHDMCEIAY